MFGSTIAVLRLFLVTRLIECLEASRAARRKILVPKRLESTALPDQFALAK